jgi:hypothetical protein
MPLIWEGEALLRVTLIPLISALLLEAIGLGSTVCLPDDDSLFSPLSRGVWDDELLGLMLRQIFRLGYD